MTTEPRKFGKDRTFQLDGGFEVLVAGAEDSLEQEFWAVFEGNEIHIYTGDAAIEMRAAKQSRGAAPPAALASVVPFVQTSAPAVPGPVMPGKDPQFLGDKSGGYTGIGPRPAGSMTQESVLADVGIDFSALAGAMNPAGAAQLNRLITEPEEIVAP